MIKLELQELGLSTTYRQMEVNVTDPKIWEKVRRRYWYRNSYYVPICKKCEVFDCTWAAITTMTTDNTNDNSADLTLF